MQMTRRRFGLAALGGVLLPAVPALAKAPFAGAQVPGVYRQKVGEFEVTVLSDGWLPIETKMYSGDQAGAEKLLGNAFLSKEATPTAVNEWLVNTGDRLVLVDTGTSNVFAPTLGRMPKSLAAAGVDPAAVDVVILTHMHPDHAAGLLTTDKKIAFPNAMGHDEVTNFSTAKDTLQFNASLFANFAAAMTDAIQSGPDTVFTIDANDSVTLDNVNRSSLTASNFHFT